jgi:hypothetical protein
MAMDCRIIISSRISSGLYKIFLEAPSLTGYQIQGQLNLNYSDVNDSQTNRNLVQEYQDFIISYENVCIDRRLGNNFYKPVSDSNQSPHPPLTDEQRGDLARQLRKQIENHIEVLNNAFRQAFDSTDLMNFQAELNRYMNNHSDDRFIKLLISTRYHGIEELPLEKISWIKDLGQGRSITVVFSHPINGYLDRQ